MAQIGDTVGMLAAIGQRIHARPQHMAAFRFAQTGQYTQQGGLSGTVRPGQKQGVTGPKRKADMIQNQPFTAENRYIFHFQQWTAGGGKGRNDGNPPIGG
ncbi:hypothetical protein AA16663_1593 [Komagataeibacter rhaeticus DSM 16663]|nr:hypothetical protein AA16663_1593 [Komagataeibacter rhaeticus DSM 16663]